MYRMAAPALAVASVLAVVAGNTADTAADTAVGIAASGEAAITTVRFTAEERRETLGYWTADRMRKVVAGAALGHDAASVKPWNGPAVKTVGRLFFTNEQGQDSYCTATAVRSRNHSAVMTAGHCVQLPASPGNHYSNMVFVPGYGEGKRPYGTFAVRAFAMPRSWERDAKNDVAVVVVDERKGKSLTDTVGGQAVAVDRKPGGKVTVFGYPDSQEQRGERLMYCAGTTKAAPQDKQSVRCPMEGGSSGGPWLADFDEKSGRGKLVSVNSFGDAAEGASAMEGEVLGATAGELHKRAQGL
ncbi:trypsin-like peptidase domain-containing protein [Streptomyces sp. NPDC086554]|uniref:trypsin-like serine peptidase n=1 Tax=Streptomyces sp. NPDC086554 TaxID=3154864 RepID=UPI003448C5B5